MASLKVHITFPENKIKEPVIYQIGQEFKVVEGDQYLCFAGAGDKFDFKSTSNRKPPPLLYPLPR